MKLNILVLTFNMTAGFLKIKHLLIAVAIVTYIKNSEHYLEYRLVLHLKPSNPLRFCNKNHILSNICNIRHHDHLSITLRPIRIISLKNMVQYHQYM